MKKQKPTPLVGSLFLLLTLLPFLGPLNLKAEESILEVDQNAAAQNSAYEKAKNGNLTGALVSAEAALKTAEKRFGAQHPSIVPALIDQAILKRTLALYADSESDLKWGLAIRERSLGPDDPLVADSLEQLAGLYNDWGRWEEAEYREKKAQLILQKEKDQHLLALSLNRLADIEINLKKYPQAILILKKNLDLLEPPKNEKSALKIEALEFLAQSFQASNNPSQAEIYFREAVRISKETLGVNSLEYCDALVAWADCQKTKNQLGQALANYRQAREVYNRFAGVGAPNPTYTLLPYLTRLASTECALGDDLASQQLWEEIYALDKKIFGSRHPQTAVTLMNLAEVEKKIGKTKISSGHFKEALDILESYFSDDYPLILKARKELDGTI